MVREPAWTRLLRDALRLLFFGLVAVAVTAAVVLPPPHPSLWVDLPARALSGALAELVLLFLLREVVPKARPGSHRVGAHRAYLSWLASSALADVALHPLVRGPFWWLQLGQVLYLKVLGARIGASVSLSPHLDVRDPCLLSCGPGAQLEPGVIVETALVGAGRVQISEVSVGPGCLIGPRCLLLPGSVIANDSRLGPGVVVGADARVGVGASIGAQTTLGEGAELGSYVSVGSLAAIGDGLRVGDRAKIAPGARVVQDIPERERWAGNPAARQENNPVGSEPPAPTDPPRQEKDIDTIDVDEFR